MRRATEPSPLHSLLPQRAVDDALCRRQNQNNGARSFASLVAVMTALAPVVACEAQVPESKRDIPDIVLPQKNLTKQGSVLSSTLSAESASSDGDEDAGECLEWITAEESYNVDTGAFLYRYTCAEGGDLAANITEGVDDFQGNGTYTQTLVLRNGDEIVWSYTYVLGDDGNSQIYDGTSSDGESHHQVRTFGDDDSIHVDEVWTLHEGVTTTVGTYDDEDRFTGTSTFDDPNTELSPDYVLHQSQGEGCAFTQTVDGTFDNTKTQYTYAVAENCDATYTFVNDDLDTLANPDFDGSYVYAADGSVHGSYVQNLDDGSTMQVDDAAEVSGVFTQAWAYDDVQTEIAVDQEGVIVYQTDGTGSGSVTYHFDDGDSQTCDVDVHLDGTTSLSNCD